MMLDKFDILFNCDKHGHDTSQGQFSLQRQYLGVLFLCFVCVLLFLGLYYTCQFVVSHVSVALAFSLFTINSVNTRLQLSGLCHLGKRYPCQRQDLHISSPLQRLFVELVISFPNMGQFIVLSLWCPICCTSYQLIVQFDASFMTEIISCRLTRKKKKSKVILSRLLHCIALIEQMRVSSTFCQPWWGQSITFGRPEMIVSLAIRSILQMPSTNRLLRM